MEKILQSVMLGAVCPTKRDFVVVECVVMETSCPPLPLIGNAAT